MVQHMVTSSHKTPSSWHKVVTMNSFSLREITYKVTKKITQLHADIAK